MSDNYYEPEDLEDFPNISENAREQGSAFYEYYEKVTSAGKLSEREKY